MSVQTPITASHIHAHHWETSSAPIAVVFGIFFLLPCGFSSLFVYDNVLLAAGFAGVGVPLLLYGVARWVSEGMSQKPLVEGLAAIGMPLFIVSEIFIFLALFAGYWLLRLNAETWPPAGSPDMPVGLPLLMTVLLISSSVTAHHAEEHLDHGNLAGVRKSLVLTLVLGVAFLSCTTFEYHHLFSEGFLPKTNIFSSVFFAVTGFHASHVALGLCAFVAVLLPALAGKANVTFLKCVSIYWHFVDVVWLFVVSQIYFW